MLFRPGVDMPNTRQGDTAGGVPSVHQGKKAEGQIRDKRRLIENDS